MTTLKTLFLCLASVVVLGCESGHPKPRVEQPDVAAGQEVVVTFDRPVDGRATNQYWLAVARPSDPDSAYIYRKDLARRATSTRLDRLPSGDYELRLHANYPVKEHDVVHRQALRIVNAAESSGAK